MFIIIKNILDNISIDDLENFIKPALDGRFYEKKENIKALKIIQMIDYHDYIVHRHGLIVGCSDSLKKRLIKTLNGRYLGYDKAVVSEYMFRSWQNDHRTDITMASSAALSKRMADRRISGLKMVTECEKIMPEPRNSLGDNAKLNVFWTPIFNRQT